MEEKPVLVYLHLPKAAGQTFIAILSRQYHADALLKVNHRDLASVSEQQLARAQCVTGHLPFGVHQYLGGRPFQYVTLLRNPIDRVISLYHYIKRTPGHFLHKELTEGGYSLKDMIERSMIADADNRQTALLAGMSDAPATTREHFECARENLENGIAAVGLTEEFDRSMLLFQRKMGWSSIFYRKRNVSPQRSSQQDLDAGTLRALKEHNELDLELYEVARARFEQAASFITGPALIRYQALNRLYGLATAAVIDARRMVRSQRRAVE